MASKEKRARASAKEMVGGGFLNDKIIRIDEAGTDWNESKYKKDEKGKPLNEAGVRLIMSVEGAKDPVERFMTAGKGLEPTEDGENFYLVDAKGINKSSSFGRFYQSLVDIEWDGADEAATNFKKLEGLIFRSLEIEEPPFQEGGKPWRVLTACEIVDEFPEPAAGKKKKAAADDDDDDEPAPKKRPAAKDDDDEEEEDDDEIVTEAAELVAGLIAKKGEIEVDDLPALVLKAAAGSKNRKAIVGLVGDPKFLKAGDWTYDKRAGTVSANE